MLLLDDCDVLYHVMAGEVIVHINDGYGYNQTWNENFLQTHSRISHASPPSWFMWITSDYGKSTTNL